MINFKVYLYSKVFFFDCERDYKEKSIAPTLQFQVYGESSVKI